MFLTSCHLVALAVVAAIELELTVINRPVKEHTELEEELHEKAHIDYDRVAIVSIPNPTLTVTCDQI